MPKGAKFNAWYWIAAFIGILFIQYLYASSHAVAPILYSEFEQFLQRRQGRRDRDLRSLYPGQAEEPLQTGKASL